MTTFALGGMSDSEGCWMGVMARLAIVSALVCRVCGLVSLLLSFGGGAGGAAASALGVLMEETLGSVTACRRRKGAFFVVSLTSPGCCGVDDGDADGEYVGWTVKESGRGRSSGTPSRESCTGFRILNGLSVDSSMGLTPAGSSFEGTGGTGGAPSNAACVFSGLEGFSSVLTLPSRGMMGMPSAPTAPKTDVRLEKTGSWRVVVVYSEGTGETRASLGAVNIGASSPPGDSLGVTKAGSLPVSPVTLLSLSVGRGSSSCAEGSLAGVGISAS